MWFAKKRLPDAPEHWHKVWKLLPVRLIDGSFSALYGQLWRRWNGSQWEYQQDPETEEEWLERQW